MSVNIRYPNISATTEKEQIAQLKSYLHQLVDQLNYALPSMGAGNSQTYQVQGQEMSYYELRSLIMQELHEVQTTFDQLSQRFDTDYVKKTEVDAIVTETLAKANESGEFDGEDGRTPVKGEDYFTEEEIASVATQAAEKILFTLDEDGNLYYELEE